MKTRYMAEYGPRLVDNGYRILPIEPGEKRPCRDLSGWTQIKADAEQVNAWASNGRAAYGVGVLGEETPAVDLDIRDEAVLQKVLAWCEENIGRAPLRVGQAPKCLLVYRAAAPFPKSKSRKFKDANGQEHQVEILGKGSQFVAYADHAGTRKPYQWPGDDIASLPVDFLPEITAEQANAVKAYFESIVPSDWTPVQSASAGALEDRVSNPRRTARLDTIEQAVRAIPNEDLDYDDWIRLGYAIKGAAGPEHESEGAALFHAWSSKSDKYDEETTETAWNAIKDVKRIGAGTLFKLAGEHGFTLPRAKAEDDFGLIETSTEDPAIEVLDEKVEPIATIQAASFAGQDKPERRFVVKDLIPDRNVTILNGDGATGKSLLAMQLGVAMAAGTRWIGLEAKKGPVVYLSAEDDADENHIRLKDICAGERIDLRALTDLHVAVMAGENCLLAVESDKSSAVLLKTKLFRKLRSTLTDLRPAMLILDNLADVFGGNENVKGLARQFIGMLRGLAIEFDCAVLLLAHPSLSGMASGSGSSGNVAWNNSVRSRLYLQRDKDSEGVEVDPNRRFLETKKANYAGIGTQIDMRWEAGRFVAYGVPDMSELDGMEPQEDKTERAMRVFMDMLARFNREGRPVSPSKGANYAPTLFSQHPRNNGVQKRFFEIAMDMLFENGSIQVEMVGPPSRQQKNIVFARGNVDDLQE